MTSKEFYALMDQAFASETQRLGLSRLRGATSLWCSTLTNGTFFYEIYIGPKRPFIPPLGGRFTVICNITATSNPKTRDYQTGISFMQYYSDDDLAKMQTIHDCIVEKIITQKKPVNEFDRMMLELHTDTLKYSLGKNFRRNQLYELPYLDEADVSVWGQFLAARLEQALQGARDQSAF